MTPWCGACDAEGAVRRRPGRLASFPRRPAGPLPSAVFHARLRRPRPRRRDAGPSSGRTPGLRARSRPGALARPGRRDAFGERHGGAGRVDRLRREDTHHLPARGEPPSGFGPPERLRREHALPDGRPSRSRVGDRAAPRLPHRPLTSSTQEQTMADDPNAETPETAGGDAPPPVQDAADASAAAAQVVHTVDTPEGEFSISFSPRAGGDGANAAPASTSASGSALRGSTSLRDGTSGSFFD